MIDLHIHTTHSSDGQYTPAEVISLAEKSGVTLLAFSDHMSLDAAEEGLVIARASGIEFFTGVELSTVWEGREHHLLCYGFDPEDTMLREFIRLGCARIWNRTHSILERFTEMGFQVGAKDIDGWGKSVPTGVTLLKALIKRNGNDPRIRSYTHGDRSDSPYLNFYQDFSHMGFGDAIVSGLVHLDEAIGILKESGVLVLAHPGDIAVDSLEKLKKCGLSGIEVYSSHHGPETISRLAGLTASMGLHASGGSDFHGELIKPDIKLGSMSGEPDPALIEAIRSFMAGWKRKANRPAYLDLD